MVEEENTGRLQHFLWFVLTERGPSSSIIILFKVQNTHPFDWSIEFHLSSELRFRGIIVLNKIFKTEK